MSLIRPKNPFLGCSRGTCCVCGLSCGVIGMLCARLYWDGVPLFTPSGEEAGFGAEVSHPATCVAPLLCNWHSCTGCVPAMKYSPLMLGQLGVASCPEAGSISTLTIPSGA